MSALDVQVGGDHYKKWKIQPVEYIHANGIPFIEGCIIKYASRWRDKGGIQDLEKIKHFVDLLIDLETRETQAESLAALAVAEPASQIDDDSPRAQAIGQNGNDGLHYYENKPSWKWAPEWAMWLGQCESGEWEWYEHEPRIREGRTYWDHDGRGIRSLQKGPFNPNWRNTLEARPCQ